MRKFKTESQRLLDLMINSIYTNKEIYLRELISNASDALDKVYLTALQAGDSSISRSDLEIQVYLDPDARTVTIKDNGIGMDKDSLETNLGTIAHSGSLEFKEGEEVKENDDIDIIGQFGVGFYSSFMVASHVSVVSKAYGSDEAWAWDSDGLKGYNITEGQRDERGTTITLTIRENDDNETYDKFLREYFVRELIKRYSDYVRYPIKMEVTDHEPLEKPEDAGDDWEQEYVDVKSMKTINSMVPIWTKKKKDVTDEEYNDFYKATFHDAENPARVISFHAEGTISYDALLFIPAHAPADLYSPDFKSGLQLYSSSVMITDDCTDLLPSCFGFIQGVVDSPDLSLNISRELLQQSKEVKAIERRIEKKIKGELETMLESDREAYEKFFREFGQTLKFHIYRSYGAQAGLLGDLLMFYSAKEDKMITLREYLEAMPEEQESIYFATGNTVDQLAKSPAVKNVVGKGFDVLLGSHQVDEFCLLTMGSYQEKSFINVGSKELDLETEEEKEQAKEADEKNADLFADMKALLGDKVVRIAASTMLTDTACCLSADGEVSLAMERYFRNLPDSEKAPHAQRVLELNMEHPAVKALQAAFEAGDTDKVEAYTKIFHDQALMSAGFEPEDIEAFNAAVCKLMA